MDPELETQKPSFFSKYKFTLVSLGIILIALVPLFLITRNRQATPAPMARVTAPSPSATPTPIPLTQQNVQPTLAATDTAIQDALTQSNQDLNSVSQINTSQDSTAGL